MVSEEAVRIHSQPPYHRAQTIPLPWHRLAEKRDYSLTTLQKERKRKPQGKFLALGTSKQTNEHPKNRTGRVDHNRSQTNLARSTSTTNLGRASD